MTIWETIIQELTNRKWSRYRLVKEVGKQIPERTVYRYLSGEFDLTTDKASIILEVLGLEIKPKGKSKKEKRQ